MIGSPETSNTPSTVEYPVYSLFVPLKISAPNRVRVIIAVKNPCKQFTKLSRLHQLLPVLSTQGFEDFHLQGMHGMDHDGFLSLPAVLGSSGTSHAVKQQLSDDEMGLLQKSAKLMAEVQLGLKF